MDCFLQGGQASSSIGYENVNYFYSFFVKLLIFALLPILLAIVSYLVWSVQKWWRKLKEFDTNKSIATMVISLFIIHPNIVQYMFNDFNCQDVDGTLRVQVDLSIVCYSKVHSFWSYSIAVPSIIVWGLGIPLFALILMRRERHQLTALTTKEKFGFLYNGYQQEMYYWEILIMYRKIGLIFISVFLQSQGVITQAMLVFLLMILFLILNMRKKPFVSMTINDLETISLLTSAITIYCGVFYISNVSAEDKAVMPATVKNSITLSPTMSLIFFLMIMAVNMGFFGYWVYKMLQEVQNTLVKKFEKPYLMLCLCGDRVALEKQKNKQAIDEENEMLREHYYKAVRNLKTLYTSGKLVLTHQTLERALVYLNEERYMESLGLAKREISLKDQRRYTRVTQGGMVKENEKEKQMYGEAHLQRRPAKGDPLDIDDRFFEGHLRDSFYAPHHHKRAESQSSRGAMLANQTTHAALISSDENQSSSQTLQGIVVKGDFLDPVEREELIRERARQEKLRQNAEDEGDDKHDDGKSAQIEKPGEKPPGANIEKLLHKGEIKVQQQQRKKVIKNVKQKVVRPIGLQRPGLTHSTVKMVPDNKPKMGNK